MPHYRSKKLREHQLGLKNKNKAQMKQKTKIETYNISNFWKQKKEIFKSVQEERDINEKAQLTW